MNDTDIKNRIVEKMLRKRIIGKKNRTVDAVVNMFLDSHEQGQGKQLIDEMIADTDAPIRAYGGSRDAIHLESAEAAVEYLKDNGGDVPFGFD